MSPRASEFQIHMFPLCILSLCIISYSYASHKLIFRSCYYFKYNFMTGLRKDIPERAISSNARRLTRALNGRLPRCLMLYTPRFIPHGFFYNILTQYLILLTCSSYILVENIKELNTTDQILFNIFFATLQ